MSRTHLGRRSVLKGLGAAAASGLVVGTATGQEEADLDSQLAAVRSATAKYEKVSAALNEGFVPLGPAVCGMGWHFINPDRGGTTLTEPNLLVYGQKTDGTLVLGGVEYGVPKDVVESAPDLFNDENGSDATEEWYPHHSRYHVFARPRREQGSEPSPSDIFDTTNWAEVDEDAIWPGEGAPATDWMVPPQEAETTVTADFDQDGQLETRPAEQVAHHPDLLTLHAWVHVANPEGVFHPFNPNELFHPEHCTPVHPH